MARGPRGPRKRAELTRKGSAPARPVATPEYEYDDDTPLSETPEYKRKQFILRLGTGILLVGFLSTSGITCVAGSMSRSHQRDVAEQSVSATPGAPADEVAVRQAQVSSDPADMEARTLLGYALLQRAEAGTGASPAAAKDLSAAREQFDVVLKKDPGSYRIHLLMGEVGLAQRDAAAARGAFGNALKLAEAPVDPKSPDKDAEQTNRESAQADAHLGLAHALMLEKHPDQALSEADKALKLNPGSGEGYAFRGMIQVGRKQPEAARKDFDYARQVAETLPPGEERQRLTMQVALGQAMVDPKPANGAKTPLPVPAPEAAAANTTAANATVPPAAPVNGSLPPAAPVNATGR